jgi:hypothetical protein
MSMPAHAETDAGSGAAANRRPSLRHATTGSITPSTAAAGSENTVDCDADIIAARLVHRLFRLAIADRSSPEEVSSLAFSLLNDRERAAVLDIDAVVTRAVQVYFALRARDDVSSLLSSADALLEVPFSLRLEPGMVSGSGGDIVVRGAIDCLMSRSEGGWMVVAVKTGEPKPSHHAQLQLHVAAAREVVGDERVTGLLVYADGMLGSDTASC